jgi:LysM repeat protein/uncharacterized protein YxeA
MKSIFTFFWLALSFISLKGQEGSLDYIKAITLEVNQHNQVYYRHTLKPKETAYSLARYFSVSIEDLLLVNKLSAGDILSIGDELIIPIDKSLLRTSIEKTNEDWVPLIYTVERQETLFKIAHSYFPQPIQNLISRNKVNSFSLKAGRNLVVGWWGAESVKITSEDFSTSKRTTEDETPQGLPTKSKEVGPAEQSKNEESIADLIRNKIIKRAKTESNEEEKKNSETQNTPVEEDIVVATKDTIVSDLVVIDTTETESQEEPQINYKSGIATWDKQGYERENLFVMHNEAKPNSYIRLRHPVTKLEVTALVLAAIPKGVHSPEVDIVLSPAVALALGALNSKFKIEMDYYQ